MLYSRRNAAGASRPRGDDGRCFQDNSVPRNKGCLVGAKRLVVIRSGNTQCMPCLAEEILRDGYTNCEITQRVGPISKFKYFETSTMPK